MAVTTQGVRGNNRSSRSKDDETKNKLKKTTKKMGDRSALDRVVATQPELGPSIPDGGFGWVVVLGSAFFQVSNKLKLNVTYFIRNHKQIFVGTKDVGTHFINCNVDQNKKRFLKYPVEQAHSQSD